MTSSIIDFAKELNTFDLLAIFHKRLLQTYGLLWNDRDKFKSEEFLRQRSFYVRILAERPPDVGISPRLKHFATEAIRNLVEYGYVIDAAALFAALDGASPAYGDHVQDGWGGEPLNIDTSYAGVYPRYPSPLESAMETSRITQQRESGLPTVELSHYVIVRNRPGLSIDLHPFDAGKWPMLSRLAGVGSLAIGISCLRNRPLNKEVVIDAGIFHFETKSATPEDEKMLEENFVESLRRLGRAGAVIAVFPELTLPEAMSDWTPGGAIRNGAASGDLSPELVVAGSYHYARDSAYSNRSDTYDPTGARIWQTSKVVPYRHRPIGGQVDLSENLALASEGSIALVDTPAGRIATVICADFLDSQVQDLLADADVDFVLVPANSRGNIETSFRLAAMQLGRRCLAVTVFANTCFGRPEDVGKAVSFVYCPIADSTKSFKEMSCTNTPPCTATIPISAFLPRRG